MKTLDEIEKLEILLIKMMDNQSLNPEDYNLISKYVAKIKNDIKSC